MYEWVTEAQSQQTDTISSATFISKSYLQAVENVLIKAQIDLSIKKQL